jgi:hypothetical protein
MDPRWGRGHEGEEIPRKDPMVTSAYDVLFVKGFLGRIGKLVEKLGVGLEGNEC